MEAESKCSKKSKKVLSHFYIPPPARKTENISPLVLNGQKSKERCVEKPKNEDENMKICNNSSLLFKLEKPDGRNAQNAPVAMKKKRKRRKNRNTKSNSDCESSLIQSPLMNENVLDSVEEVSAFKDLTICEDRVISCDISKKVISSIPEKLYEDGVKESSHFVNDEHNNDSYNSKNASHPTDHSTNENPGLLFNTQSNKSTMQGGTATGEYVTNISERNEIQPYKKISVSNMINDEKFISKSTEQITDSHISVREEGNSVLIDDWEKLLEDDMQTIVAKSKASEHTLSTKKYNHIDEEKETYSEKENDSSVIEIYGFPEEFKTQDLYASFSPYVNRGFQLKWVDNTHALGIFPSPSIADEVLSSVLPFVKTRPISQATPLSKEKAKNLILPSSSRPKTCSALARRLVSGALGVRAVFTPAEIKAEREILKEAREQRKLAARQRDAAWEGKF